MTDDLSQGDLESFVGMDPGGGVFDRSLGIGGSDVGAMLGISPFRSEWDLWLEKTHDPAWRPQPETAPMRLGKLLEPIVAGWYQEQHPEFMVTLHPEQDRVVWHPNGVLYAHIDADVREPMGSAQSQGVGILEMKVPRDDREWPGGPPMHYESQGRAYLACSPWASWLDFAILYRSTAEFAEFRLYRDSKLEDGIARRAEEWWERRVVRGEPPPLDASTGATAYLATKYRAPTTDDLLLFDEQFETTVRAYLATKALVSRGEKNIALLRNQIISVMGEYPRAEGLDWHIIFKRTKGARTVAWKEVAGALRRMIEEYRTAKGPGIEKLDATRNLLESDLDVIEGLYATEGDGSRPLLVKDDTEK